MYIYIYVLYRYIICVLSEAPCLGRHHSLLHSHDGRLPGSSSNHGTCCSWAATISGDPGVARGPMTETEIMWFQEGYKML